MEEKTEREKTRARSGTAVGAYRFCGEEGTGGQLSDCVQRISSGALRLFAVCGSPGIERKENDAQQPFYGGLDRENALHPQSQFSRITAGINSTALRRTVMVRECSALSSAWKQLVTMLITPSAGADRQRTCRNCAVCAIWGSLWREMPARCAGWNGNRFGCTAAHPASVGVGGQGGESRERSLSTAGTGSELPSGAGALKRPRT